MWPVKVGVRRWVESETRRGKAGGEVVGERVLSSRRRGRRSKRKRTVGWSGVEGGGEGSRGEAGMKDEEEERKRRVAIPRSREKGRR